MHQQGKHRKKNDDRLIKQFLVFLVTGLCLMQILMLNGDIRNKLSIVDQMEGQQLDANLELNKK